MTPFTGNGGVNHRTPGEVRRLYAEFVFPHRDVPKAALHPWRINVISGVIWQPQRTAVETGVEAATAEASQGFKPGMALIGTGTRTGDKLPLFLATQGKRNV
jgi:hypothetical protein